MFSSFGWLLWLTRQFGDVWLFIISEGVSDLELKSFILDWFSRSFFFLYHMTFTLCLSVKLPLSRSTFPSPHLLPACVLSVRTCHLRAHKACMYCLCCCGCASFNCHQPFLVFIIILVTSSVAWRDFTRPLKKKNHYIIITVTLIFGCHNIVVQQH